MKVEGTAGLEVIMCVDLEKLRASHMQTCQQCQVSFRKALQLWQELMETGEELLPPEMCTDVERIINDHRDNCKKCQENRARLQQIEVLSHQDIINARKKVANKRKCFSPDTSHCDGGIIDAHSVQRKQLEKIARNGHVYHFKGSYDNLLRHDGVFNAMLIGLKQASTFTGFCCYHDNTLFAPVEQEEFVLDRESAFLLSYRAVCFEQFNQEIWLDLFPMFREIPRGLPLPFYAMTQNEISRDESFVKWGLRGIRATKLNYDDVLLKKDFSDMNYYAVEVDSVLPFLCSSVTSPEWDFEGKTIQRFAGCKIPAALTMTVLINGTRSILLFGWLGNNEEVNEFLKSFHAIPDEELLEAVRRFVFEFIENVYFQPEWWEANPEIRRFLEERIMARFKKRVRGSPQQLVNDNLRFLSGNIASRLTTIAL